MSLSPEQRDDLRRLLAAELRSACHAAAAEGATAETLGGLLERNLRAVRDSCGPGPARSPGHGDHGQDRGDDPLAGGGVGEQP